MSTSRPRNPGQLSTNLPGVTHYVTGHDASTGKAVVQSTREGSWTRHAGDSLAFDVVYTTSEFPVSLNEDKDLTTHDELISTKQIGLVNPNGTVCRIVDFGPGSEPLMHRTQSLDYGLVLEGSVEMILDSGETKLLHRGDVAVQRGTMHAWRNTSKTEWARMFFVLQHCQEVVLNGTSLGEDLRTVSDSAGSSDSNPKPSV
ncbi:hypothetical protein MMC07_001082 [Pseudocyphellaria aurata]|nr:hypothetical protein [Pseudocyphellaria aurata]